MEVPPAIVIGGSLKVGVVYKFEAPELIETSIPHYFIVVAIEDSDNYLVVCTTQFTKRLDYIQKKGYDLNTLVYLPPTKANGLTDKSYVDCNFYHPITKPELISKVSSKGFKLVGNLTEEEYEKVKRGISLSYINDLPDGLLKFGS